MNITVLISGSGTNLQALIDAQTKGLLKGTITRVISSSSRAYGLERAQKAGIPTKTHILATYRRGIDKNDATAMKETRERYMDDLTQLLLAEKPHLIVCAGWMLILSPKCVDDVSAAGVPLINLHPALPGAFDGTHAIQRTWQAGQEGKISTGGVMVHRLIAEVDRGEPIVVKRLELFKEETVEEYEERVHEAEREAIVEATNIVCEELTKQ